MSVLLYAEQIRAAITRLDINGQGPEARLDPGTPLHIKGTYRVQNPRSDPTDTVQLIIMLEDKFLKCVYNDVPAAAPRFTEGSFEFSCTVPSEEGRYTIRAGWGYNWNWPEQAYNYLLANPENIEDVGVLYVGKFELAMAEIAPALIVALPVAIVIGLMAIPKKGG